MTFFSSRGSFSSMATRISSSNAVIFSWAAAALLGEELLHLGIERALIQQGVGLVGRGHGLGVLQRQPMRFAQHRVGPGDIGVARLVVVDGGVRELLR